MLYNTLSIEDGLEFLVRWSKHSLTDTKKIPQSSDWNKEQVNYVRVQTCFAEITEGLFRLEMCLPTFMAAEGKVWVCRRDERKQEEEHLKGWQSYYTQCHPYLTSENYFSPYQHSFHSFIFPMSATWNKSVKGGIRKVLIMFSSSYRRLFREKIKVICKILIKRKILQKGFRNHQYDEGGNKSLVVLFIFLFFI